jgi:predicted TIM-barrel fold metal-dependent hydrolase
MGGRQDFHWGTCCTLALGFAAERSALLRDLCRVRGRRRAILHTDRPHRAAKTLGNWRLIPYLEEVLLDFPELVVVAGHVGFPWLDELVTLTVKFQNFHVDTSAYVLHRLPPAFVAWMKGIGKNRVMFGTNWPMLSPRKCLEGLSGLGLSDEQTEMFLSGNARRIFKL